MIAGRYMEGLMRARSMFEGASKKTYVTAKVSTQGKCQDIDLRTEEDNQRDTVLIRGEAKVLVHAGNFCVANTVDQSQSFGRQQNHQRHTSSDPCKKADT